MPDKRQAVLDMANSLKDVFDKYSLTNRKGAWKTIISASGQKEIGKLIQNPKASMSGFKGLSFAEWMIESTESPEAIELAQKIVNGTAKLYGGSLDEPTVMYDALWKDPPVFLNIKAKLAGKGLGWIAFLDFLSKVNINQEFLSTDFTPAGQALFNKAVSAGLIKPVPSQANIGNYTLWHVLADVDPILNKIASLQPNPKMSYISKTPPQTSY